MGAMVTIRYNSDSVENDKISILAEAAKKIVEVAIEDSDVIVFVDKSLITISVDAIEIFVQVNTNKINEPQKLTDSIAEKISSWKTRVSFTQNINLNVIPVIWYSKINL